MRVVFQRQERCFIVTGVLLAPKFNQLEISSLTLVVEPATDS